MTNDSDSSEQIEGLAKVLASEKGHPWDRLTPWEQAFYRREAYCRLVVPPVGAFVREDVSA